MEGSSALSWRKASYSGNNGGNCVEVGQTADTIAVRDTTDRVGAVLSIPASAWQTFTDGLK
jgi:hypothetical protein